MRVWLGLSICLAAFRPAKSADGRKVFPADGIDFVEIATERGDIIVAGSGRLTVEAEPVKAVESGKKCALTMKHSAPARKITLEVKSAGFLKSGDCLGGFRVEIPKRLGVRASSGRGDIELSGIEGEVSAEAGTGDIRVESLRGEVALDAGTGAVSGSLPGERRLTVKAGTGAVDLKGLVGGAEVESGTGEVRLEWTKAPGRTDKAKAKIQTGTGGAAAYFPAGSAVKARLVSGTGRSSNELGDSPDSAFSLTLESGSGSVSVLKVASDAGEAVVVNETGGEVRDLWLGVPGGSELPGSPLAALKTGGKARFPVPESAAKVSVMFRLPPDRRFEKTVTLLGNSVRLAIRADGSVGATFPKPVK